MKSYHIHLIRHGLSEGNKLGQYIGVTDSPLSPEGKALLLEKKQAGAYPKAAVCYSSPLSRCLDSAKLVYPDCPPRVIMDFRECDFGAWEGKTAKELEKEPMFREWMESGGHTTPPFGESGGAFIHRTCLAFEKLVRELLQSGITDAAVVAHGGTLMAILSTYGLPRAPFYDWLTEPGSGYSLRITPGLWMRSMVAEVYETIPPREAEREVSAMDVAREAARRAYGEPED